MSWQCEEYPFLPDSLSSHKKTNKKKQTNKQIKQKKEEDADMP